ncbi:chondroitin sulfate proteoglycan 4-like [Babylonia areolata]|uniref:chondroitin sulfate proteoglycan 4-like n=1 Tax=Babylonia areolata TaxID=304850 RepID=UPI003FD54032
MARLECHILLFLLARVVSIEQSASFYGESYISIPLEDARSSTALHLHFQTHRPHGLLLLAAGSTDHFLVEVKAGRVEVSINLGSGEASVFSAPSVRLDDQQWHEVQVDRSGERLELRVDGVVQGAVDTPGSFHELNVQDGVFLGGMGTYSNGLDARLRSYRGCMKDVVFNGVDILTMARSMKSVQNAFEIAWDCDSEFSAGSDDPVSLLSETSFVAFSRFHVGEKGSFACDFKTRSENAVILFNSGRGDYKDDFLSLEIVEGRPKLSVNSGSGVVEVVLVEMVNDGRWHELDLSVSQSTVELRVDSISNTTRFGGETSHINLAGHLFVGGLGLKARAHALRLGLRALQGDRSMKGSMLGCIRNIVINSRPYGFREVQVSRHIDPVCSWVFPCAPQPCIEGAECVETGDMFRCVCDQPVCEKEDSSSSNNLPEEDFREMVAIVPLNVKEGGEAIINTNTIDVIFDYRSYRIREIAVRFRVVLPPRFGHLEVDRGQRQSEAFTLLDLLTAKVRYVHDGTDSQTDDITMEMSISSNSELPHKFRGHFEFVLPIKIIAHNDPPKLYLPSGNQISVLENSKLQLTTSVIDVKDPDTKSKNLRYSVHYIRPVESFFEDYSKSEQPTTSFSHQDILDGKIWFAHKKDSVVDMRMNVTDDSNLKDSLLVRFLMVSLKIEMEKNTGLTVPYSSNTLFHSSNLSAMTNVPLQNLELRYRITKLPRFGQIQRLQHGFEEWTDVDTFTQRHLNSSRLRYSHFSSDFSVPGDQFSFTVSAKEVQTKEQVFKITFRPVTLTITNNNRLMIHQLPYAQLTNTSLLVSPELGQIDTTKLTFVLFRMPKLGDVYVTANNRIFNPLDFDSLKPIKTGGNFSQADLDSGRVYFKFDSTGFDRLEDYIDLTIKYPSSSGRMMRLWVEYIPLDTAIRFTNNGLRDVVEGGQKAITRSNLYLEMEDYKEFQFSLIQPPRHGNVSRWDGRTSSIVDPMIEEFSSADIREGRVVYRHDDSEHDRDSFVFAAIPLFKSEEEMPEEIQEFTGTFHISVAMRNDNPPERLVDKVFHIVTNGRKKITIHDLAFTDPDIHYDTSKLQYRRQTIPNGEILLAGTNTPVYRFSQKDLEDEKLVFHHKGPEVGRTAIFVTDGQFFWTGLFEVQASEPFIQLGNNTGVTVFRGGEAVLTAANLSLLTNMDFPPTSFSFMVTEPPQHGALKMEGDLATEFTYADIVHGNVHYEHDGSDSEEDRFRFTVVRGQVQLQEVFPIMVKDDKMMIPPHVVHNHMLVVDERETVQITESHLLVQHPSLNEEEVVFVVTTPPEHGVLQLRGTPFSPDDPIQFSQGEISRGLVEYIQTEDAVVDDRFVFDVDSDSRVLKNLVFSIEVRPSSLPVRSGNLTVAEGGTATLSSNTLRTLGSKYQDENLVYEIIHTPAHGYIVNSDKPTMLNMAFSSDSILEGKILYQHDDSESRNDSFTVVASLEDGSLKSKLLDVKVTVVPEDDQPPRVVVNKDLSVWADSVTLLTGDHLHADDPDTSSEDIIFTVTAPPTNGHLAFLNNTFLPVTHFSQLDIDAGHVAFVHKGESTGQFSFRAGDGRNSDVQRVFRVRAHPVVLRLWRRGPLSVFPNTIHPLSNRSLLAATTAANFSKPIVFTIVEPKPLHGQLVTMVAGRAVAIQSFTQQEVNSGKVFYQHLSYMDTWRQTDAIHLEVSTAYANPLTGATCQVLVSYGNINAENQAMLLGVYEPSVQEGGSLTISRDYFDSTQLLKRLHAYRPDITMTFQITAPPTHGDLHLGDAKVTSATAFTQDDIDADRLRYSHDDSDTVADVFSVAVEMENVGEGGEDGVASSPPTLNFTIRVEAVNDEHFRLVTQNPALRVLQGGEVVLTAEHLQTVDPDTPPSHIVYTVLSQPTNGQLRRVNDTTHTPVESFTQEDLDHARLLFWQNGTRKSGTVNLMVTDGKFPEEYTILDILVVPVRIDMSQVQPVALTQSESSVYLSGKFMNVTTNGVRDALHYKVVEKPAHGQILLRGREAKYFSQRDVDMDSVTYVMLNFSTSQDVFRCDLHMENLEVSLKNQVFRIVVKPLVTHVPLLAPPGSKVAITKANLDASELAKRTSDIPAFEITDPPSHGQILRKLRKRRDLIAQPVLKPVEKFTFEDIEYIKIYYVSNATSKDGPGIPDRFSYVLRAGNAQPAEGHFLINLDEWEEGGGEEGDDDQDAEESEETEGGGVIGANVGGDEDGGDMMIVGIVLGVLLVLVVVGVVVVVLWRRRQRSQGDYQEGGLKIRSRPRPYISGPLQLEQPHVHIQPQESLPSSPEGAAGEQGEEEEEERCLMPPSPPPPYFSSHLPAVNLTHDPSALALLSPTPRSPDLSRTEVSPAVPDCKVTPLVEVRGEEGGSAGGQRTSGRSSTGTDPYDWALMDPELLQHCRTETPVLKGNQYWV